jgi:DNA mismatch repair protein MutS
MMIDARLVKASSWSAPRAAGRPGSLLHAVDRTVTGAGARLLAADIAAP